MILIYNGFTYRNHWNNASCFNQYWFQILATFHYLSCPECDVSPLSCSSNVCLQSMQKINHDRYCTQEIRNEKGTCKEKTLIFSFLKCDKHLSADTKKWLLLSNVVHMLCGIFDKCNLRIFCCLSFIKLVCHMGEIEQPWVCTFIEL